LQANTRQRSLFAVCRECQTDSYIRLGEVRKVGQYFSLSHSGVHIAEHIFHRDAQSADAGFAAALAGSIMIIFE